MTWVKVLLAGDAAELSDTPSVNLDFGAASAGVASEASRDDHKHDLTDATTGDIVPVDGTAEAVGTTSTVSRGDHRHGLGPLVAALDFSQEQAVGLVLHKSAAAPNSGAEVEGQVYYDTTGGDQHPYIWVP